MRHQLSKTAICAAIVSLISATPASADLWKCGKRYTNKPTDKATCFKVQSSTICGKKGNKYFTPSKSGVSKVVAECETTDSQSSPIVNLALIEQLNAEEEAKKGNTKSSSKSYKKKTPSRGFFAKISCFLSRSFNLGQCD